MAARPAPPPAGVVRALYRSFLRRARGVFDPVARAYVETEVRRRFRRYQSVPTAAVARARLGEGQRLYRQLGRAIYGDRKAATKLVDLAYGRRGHMRHAMLRDFVRAHPHDADRLLREFVPQDLVKRNRTRVFPPAPAALQAQAETILQRGYARRWRRLYGELLGRMPVTTADGSRLTVSKLTRGTLLPIRHSDLAGLPPPAPTAPPRRAAR